ncbi:MAG: hypothetical protein GY754_19120 [bacterium]|nr:hypothetical protein [bacterium]
MKQTDLNRHERDLRRAAKKSDNTAKRAGARDELSVGNYIDKLFSLFMYDDSVIFNTMDDLNILELIEDLKEMQPEKQWDNILRKAIRKTKIANKETAFEEIKTLF